MEFTASDGIRLEWLPRVAKEGLRGFLANTIHERLTNDQPGLIEWFLDEASKNDTPYIGRFIGLMTTLDWYDELHRIECPTLIVYPGAESVGSTDNYDLMRKVSPDVPSGPLAGARSTTMRKQQRLPSGQRTSESRSVRSSLIV